MNKKVLIITIVSLLVSFIAISGLFYLQSFKTIQFDLKKEPIKVTIYKDGNPVTSITNDSELRLQTGEYVYTSEGGDYENTPTGFTVKDSTSIAIDPPYSAAYRTRVLNAELPAITKALTTAYPIVATDFKLDRGDIYLDGSWYATTFTQKPATRQEQGDMYRAVLRKENGAWVIKTKPALLLTTQEYPDVPFEILSDINDKR